MKKHQPLAQRLTVADTILNNILGNKEILDAVNLNGFSMEQLSAARKQLEEIRALDKVQRVEYGEQYQATENFDKGLADFYKLYMRTLKIARLAFNDQTEIRTALLLDGNRMQNFASLYKQADTFYTNLLNKPEYQQFVARFNITPERLKQEYALLTGLNELNSRQQKETGEAVEATRARDAKVEPFDKFMAELTKICKIIFDDEPNNLKIIGITV